MARQALARRLPCGNCLGLTRSVSGFRRPQPRRPRRGHRGRADRWRRVLGRRDLREPRRNRRVPDRERRGGRLGARTRAAPRPKSSDACLITSTSALGSPTSLDEESPPTNRRRSRRRRRRRRSDGDVLCPRPRAWRRHRHGATRAVLSVMRRRSPRPSLRPTLRTCGATVLGPRAGGRQARVRGTDRGVTRPRASSRRRSSTRSSIGCSTRSRSAWSC